MHVTDIREKIRPVLEAGQAHWAVLFGSWARGTQTRRSDIDLLIVVETDKRWLDRDQDFANIYRLFPKQGVDLLIYTPEELEDIIHRPFIQRILGEGKVIYESGEAGERGISLVRYGHKRSGDGQALIQP
ncbi:MAG: nucleotidyltransferase domain-containing protein [Desulfovermiculus sp.]